MEPHDHVHVQRALSGDNRAYGELIGAYQGMVFAVALNVTGNYTDSEDVVQEAFLRAYQKLRTLSDPARFGPWLHTIAKRAAIQSLRDRRRVPVSSTEESVEDRADPDELTPAEIYAQSELKQSVLAEIAELPPRTREAILLFYMEGFSIKGAASFLGITEGAMKMRLDFGRAKLRQVLTQNMEEELRQKRPSRKMRAAILAALPTSATPTITTSAVGSWVSWLASTKVVAAGLLATALVIGSLVAFRGDLLLFRKPVDASARRIESRPKPDTRATPSVSLTKNKPIAAAVKSSPQATTSGQQSVSENSADKTAVNEVDGSPSIRGHVLDTTGKPVASASVNVRIEENSWRNVTAKADADGAYSIGGLSVTGKLKIRAFLPGLSSPEKGPLTLAAEGLNGVDLIVEPTGTIEGKVLTASGKPFAISDSYIELLNAPLMAPRASRAIMKDGLFRIPNLPAGHYELYIDVPLYRFRTGWRQPYGTVDIEPDKIVKDVTLTFDDENYNHQIAQESNPEEKRRQKEEALQHRRSEWRVSGQVIDANTGAPIPNFDLASHQSGFFRGPVKELQGRFSFAQAESPAVVLKIGAAHYASQSVTVTAEQTSSPIMVKLKPGAVIEGTVVDPDDNPVMRAKVYPNDLGEEHMSNQSVPIETDRAGAFRLDTLDIGRQRVCVEHPAFAIRWIDVTTSPGKPTPIAIKLTHGGGVEGTVTSAGSKMAKFHVSCRMDGGSGLGERDRMVTTDDAGHFLIENVTPGPLDLAIFPDTAGRTSHGYHIQKRTVLIEEGVNKRLDAVFAHEEIQVRGTLTLRGEPTGPGWVHVHRKESEYSESWNSAAVDKSGNYQTVPLPAGEFILEAIIIGPSGLRLTQRIPITLVSGESAVKNVDFSGGGVSGTVSGLLAGERAVVAATPGDVPYPSGPSYSSALLTDSVAESNVENGGYQIEALPPGTYTIRAVSMNWPSMETGTFRAGSKLITITEDENVDLNLTLEEHH